MMRSLDLDLAKSLHGGLAKTLVTSGRMLGFAKREVALEIKNACAVEVPTTGHTTMLTPTKRSMLQMVCRTAPI